MILDVRTPEEIAEGYIQGAVFADFKADNFRDKIQELDKTADYVVHCRSGQRSEKAIEIMTELGFTGTLVNGGGMEEAAESTGLPVVK
jgi:rhodanese-related sulfurtransferase